MKLKPYLKLLLLTLISLSIFILLAGNGFAFQPGCSTNYADYIVVDQFNDSDNTNLVNHPPTGGAKNNDTAGWYNYGGATTTQNVLGNIWVGTGNDDFKGLRFKNIGNTNITVKINVKLGIAGNHNMYLGLHEGAESFAGCRWGTLAGGVSWRYVDGASDIDNTVVLTDWVLIKTTADQSGNCWYKFYNSTGSLTIDSGKRADTVGAANSKNALDIRAQSSINSYADNLTLY